MPKVVAFIPIKLNNQRLPGKNTMQLGDKALCQYIFETVLKVDNIDETYVFCSDEEICKYIPQGINYLKRTKDLDSDTTKSTDIISAFINCIEADVYALMHVTQPFLKKESIENTIDKVLHGGHDSAFVAHEIKEFAWYNGMPLNYNMSNVVRTQELEPVYTEGELYVFQRNVFLNKSRRIGDSPYIYPITQKENICIDTLDDFRMAEIALKMEDLN